VDHRHAAPASWQTDAVISTRAALLLVVMLAACTAASGPDSAPASPAPASPSPGRTASAHPVDGITATVVQYTRDRPERRIQVKLTNTSEHALDVTLLEPRFHGFATAQPPARTSHLEPDRRVDVPVELGEPACDAPAGGASEVVVRGVTADGVSQQRMVPIDDEDRLITRVQALDCDVARVEEAVDLTLADTWERTGTGADAAVTGHVTMALRPGGGSVRVTDLDAGLLLRITSGRPEPGGTDPTYQVDAAQPRTEWDVELVGARCDGPALAESRRLMALTFLVSLDGAEPVRLRRSPDVDGYNMLSAALLERCEHREG
jgi:hypothetical protein